MLKHTIPWEDVFHASLDGTLLLHVAPVLIHQVSGVVRHREGEMTVLSEDFYLPLELSVWFDSVHLPIRLTLQKECRAGY